MKRLLVAIAATALALGAGAGETEVRATLKRVFPQGQVQSLEKTPVPGLIEATVEGRIVYITEDGRYLLAEQGRNRILELTVAAP